MRLGMELLASRPAAIRLGTFFETWLATPAGTVRRSLGRDEFHLDLVIGEGGRLAATGRTHISQVNLEDAGLGRNQTSAAQLAAAELPPGTPVLWAIRTNLYLSIAALVQGAHAHLLLSDATPVPIRLDDPQLIGEETAPGRFLFDISAFLLREA